MDSSLHLCVCIVVIRDPRQPLHLLCHSFRSSAISILKIGSEVVLYFIAVIIRTIFVPNTCYIIILFCLQNIFQSTLLLHNEECEVEMIHSRRNLTNVIQKLKAQHIQGVRKMTIRDNHTFYESINFQHIFVSVARDHDKLEQPEYYRN